MSNVYYDPEDFGLKTVAVVDWSDGYYQFDYSVVWADAENNLYYGRDSGCSCPSPFEDCAGVQDLTPMTINEIRQRVGEIVNYNIHSQTDYAGKAFRFLERLQEWQRGLEQR